MASANNAVSSFSVSVAHCVDCFGFSSKAVQFADDEERRELRALGTDCAQEPKMVGVEASVQVGESLCWIIDRAENENLIISDPDGEGPWLKVK